MGLGCCWPHGFGTACRLNRSRKVVKEVGAAAEAVFSNVII